MWLVGVGGIYGYDKEDVVVRLVKYMDEASGCGCKEVYRVSHIIYPYSCVCSFWQKHHHILVISYYCRSFW